MGDKRGKQVDDKRTPRYVADLVKESIQQRVNLLAGDLKAETTRQIDKLESIFDERVAKALNKLGAPSAQDLAALVRRIDELAAEIAALKRGTAAAKKKKTKAATSRAAPAKRASRVASKVGKASSPTRKA